MARWFRLNTSGEALLPPLFIGGSDSDSSRSWQLRYGVAAGATGLALVLKLLLGPVIAPGTFLTFFGAVLFSAGFGGLGPGVLSTALSAVLSAYFFLPLDSFAGTTQMAALRLTLFVFVAALVSWVTAAMRAAQRRGAEVLRAARDELEMHVAARTAELSEANRRLRDEIAGRQQAEERFRNAFEFTPIGMAVADIDGRLLEVNDALCRILGYRCDELLPKLVWELMHPDEVAAARADWARLLAGEARSYQAERCYLHKSGHAVWVELGVSLVRDHEGRPLHSVAHVHDITERRRVEQAQRESEGKFRTLTETIAAAAFIFQGPQMRYANPAAAVITGYTHDELLAMNFWDVIHPDFRDRVRQRGLARQRGVPLPNRYEVKILTKAGEERWVDFSGCTVEFGGQPAVLGTAFDITDRKHAEDSVRQARDALEARVAQRTSELSEANRLLGAEIAQRRDAENAMREREQLFRATFEQAAVGVSLTGSDGRWIMVNDRLCQILGYTRDELLQRTFRDVTHPDDLEASLALVERLVRGEVRTYTTEKRYVRKDGSVVWTNLTASTVREPAGQLKYGIAIVEDISERKLAAEAVRESEERLRRLVEHLPAVTYMLAADEARTPLYVSPQIESILGFRPAEWVADAGLWKRQIHPADRDRVMRQAAHSYTTGEPFSSEYRLLTRDGEAVWFRDQAVGVRDDAGRVILTEGVMTDITDRKRTEEELAASNLRTQSILENLADGFFALDHHGRFTYLNPSALQLMGRRREDLIGQNVWSVFPGAANSPFYAQYQRVMAERVPLQMEAYYAPLNRWFKAHTYPSQDGLSVLFEDVTSRHKQEISAVSDVLSALNAQLDVRQAFTGVAEGLRLLTQCDRVSLTVFDEDGEWATVLALDRPRSDVEPGSRLRMADIPATMNVLSGWPHLVPDLAVELHSPIVQTIYQAGMRSAVSLPLRGSNQVGGMLTLTARRPSAFSLAQLPLLGQVADAIALAVEKSRLFEEVRAGRERLEALSHRLLEVQEAERQHIARELHDEIGQALTALKLTLDTVAGLRPEQVAARLSETRGQVNELVARVRNLALDLRPAMLDDLGLLPALLWLFERYTVQTGVQVHFEHRGLGRRFTPDIETAAYRIVQEALTNVARYAGVEQVTVRAWSDLACVALQVVDQGAGFDAAAALRTAATSGVAGMRERAVLLGGQLTVESAPGKGTRVSAELPLQETLAEGAVCR